MSNVTNSIFLLLVLIWACNNNSQQQVQSKLDYTHRFLRVEVHGTGSLDTNYRYLRKNYLASDAYRCTYQLIPSSRDTLFFKKKDEILQYYVFPTKEKGVISYGYSNVYLSDIQTINYKERKYQIYQYILLMEHSDDADMIYFFNPEMGLLVEKSLNWGNYYRLIDIQNDPQSKDLIFYLCEKIISDRTFFHPDELPAKAEAMAKIFNPPSTVINEASTN